MRLWQLAQLCKSTPPAEQQIAHSCKYERVCLRVRLPGLSTSPHTSQRPAPAEMDLIIDKTITRHKGLMDAAPCWVRGHVKCCDGDLDDVWLRGEIKLHINQLNGGGWGGGHTGSSPQIISGSPPEEFLGMVPNPKEIHQREMWWSVVSPWPLLFDSLF